MRPTYYALFDGEEISGTRYTRGEEISADADRNAIVLLEAQGRVSTTKPDDGPTIPFAEADLDKMGRSDLIAALVREGVPASVSDDEIRATIRRAREDAKDDPNGEKRADRQREQREADEQATKDRQNAEDALKQRLTDAESERDRLANELAVLKAAPPSEKQTEPEPEKKPTGRPKSTTAN